MPELSSHLNGVHLKAIDFHRKWCVQWFAHPHSKKTLPMTFQWPCFIVICLPYYHWQELLLSIIQVSIRTDWNHSNKACVLIWFVFLSVALQNSPPRNQLCERRKQHRTDLAKLTFDLYKNNPKDFIGCLNVKATLYGVYSVSYDLRCYAAKKMLKWVKEPAKSPRPSDIFMLLFWLCNTCLFFFTLKHLSGDFTDPSIMS